MTEPRFATFGPGSSPTVWTPGEILLTRNLAPWFSRSGWVSGGIRHVQRHRFTGDDRKWCWPNHVCCVTSESGDLVEALGHGVMKTHADKYRPVEYRVVHTGLDAESAQHAVAYWNAAVGEHYGFVSCASIALGEYLDWPIEFGERASAICSGLAAEGLVAGGVLFPRGWDPPVMMPAHLCKHWEVAV